MAEASGIYLVEQYKTRQNSAWALADIESVLCDLRRAVRVSRPATACYRFVTDGRAGKLDTFNVFLADVKSASRPDDLDNIERKRFKADFIGTNRTFFDHIAAVTRSSTLQSAVEEHTVVFHLLSSFEMEFGADADTTVAKIERLLRRYAPDLGDERRIRVNLVGLLFGTLSKGETRLDTAGIDALFRQVGLSPERLRAQPELTRQRIRELAESDPKGRQLIEQLFWERPDEMDEAMLRFVLRMLERDLREHFDEAVTGEPIWLFHPLDFLGRIARPELLGILGAEAGGELEQLITAVARSRLRTNSRCRDHVLESARRVLILMGGEGITTLIKRELESEHFWIRHGGLKWALVRADDGIVERLAAIARRQVPRDANGKPESNSYQEFYGATTALAALGADTALIESLQHSGMAEVPVDLAELRAHCGPMPKALTNQALQTLQSSAPSEDSLLIALVIAWLSDDADLMPVVRAVFERADLEGQVAAYACIALQALGDPSNDFAQLVQRLVHTEANSTWGLNALLTLGDRGLELLGEWLKGRSAIERTDHDVLAMRALYGKPATRKLSVDAAVDFCLHGRRLHDGAYWSRSWKPPIPTCSPIAKTRFGSAEFSRTTCRPRSSITPSRY